MKEEEYLLKVENLGVSFSQYTQGLKKTSLQVITNLCVELRAGEILAVVGSSGSGKSLLAHAILGILPDNAEETGSIFFEGKKLTQRDKELLRGKEIALIPQSVNFLDPLQKVGEQITSNASGSGTGASGGAGRTHGADGKTSDSAGKSSGGVFGFARRRRQRTGQAEALLARYGLDRAVARYFPHQLSGGMARKVLLQTALAADCRAIVADEPTPGLDPDSLAEVLHDFRAAAAEG